MKGNSLIIFLLALFLSLVMGFLLKINFNEKRINELVLLELKKNQELKNIKIKNISLNLSRGLLPDFSLKIDYLSFLFDYSPQSQIKFSFNEALIPINFLSFLKGRIVIHKKIFIDSVKIINLSKLNLNYNDNLIVEIFYLLKSNKIENYLNKFNFLNDIFINKLYLQEENNSYFHFTLNKINFNKESHKNFELKFKLLYNFLSLKNNESPNLNINMKLKYFDKKIIGRISGNWREGLIKLQYNFDNIDNTLTIINLIKNLPLNNLIPFIKELKLIKIKDLDYDFNQIWLYCNNKIIINFNKKEKPKFNLSGCNIKGDFGKIIFEDFYFNDGISQKNWWLNPFKINLLNVSLEKIFDHLKINKINKNDILYWFKNISELSGTVNFKEDKFFVYFEIEKIYFLKNILSSKQTMKIFEYNKENKHKEGKYITLNQIKGRLIFDKNLTNLKWKDVEGNLLHEKSFETFGSWNKNKSKNNFLNGKFLILNKSENNKIKLNNDKENAQKKYKWNIQGSLSEPVFSLAK